MLSNHAYRELLWPFTRLPAQYVVVDTETTGLFDGDSAPGLVSIGLVEVNESQLFSETEIRVRPWTKISREAQDVHGISNEDANKFPELSEVWPELMQLISGRLLVMHNASYDWRVLVENSARAGLRLPSIRGVFCTQKTAYPWAEAIGLPVSRRGPALDTLTQHLGIEDHRAELGFHGALVDAKQTAH